MNNPHLLVLDEPAQNLDISGQLGFYRLVEKIYKERKISVLMVSHDLHLVMASTKEVICLFHHVCCSGEPQIVAKDPEFVSLFGNDMATMMAAISIAMIMPITIIIAMNLEPFLVNAILAGFAVAVITGVMGCFVVWRRMAYFGLARP